MKKSHEIPRARAGALEESSAVFGPFRIANALLMHCSFFNQVIEKQQLSSNRFPGAIKLDMILAAVEAKIFHIGKLWYSPGCVGVSPAYPRRAGPSADDEKNSPPALENAPAAY